MTFPVNPQPNSSAFGFLAFAGPRRFDGIRRVRLAHGQVSPELYAPNLHRIRDLVIDLFDRFGADGGFVHAVFPHGLPNSVLQLGKDIILVPVGSEILKTPIESDQALESKVQV